MGSRKYFLDWLRVLAFGGLTIFHVGMLYVTWSYNLKSARLVPGLEPLMEALSAWRMALLFVISGVACRFLIGRLGAWRFAGDRVVRLQPAVLTGMLLINPLQVWVQLRVQGDTALPYPSYWLWHYLLADSRYFDALGRPTPTWDHLWFLIYLLAYGLVFAAAFPALRRVLRGTPPASLLLIAPALWMAGTDLLIYFVAPFTHAFYNDWAAHMKWAGLFAAGAALAPRSEIWEALASRRRALAVATVALMAVYMALHTALLQRPQDPAWSMAYKILGGIYGWMTILTVCGFAKRWLDRPSATLTYLTDAVLPIYMLHQPVLLTAAWLLFPYALPLPVEAMLLVVATGVVPLGFYHLLIRRWPPVRALFGLRMRRREAAPKSALSPADA